MESRTMLVVANWKMHPRTVSEARELIAALVRGVKKVPETTTVVIAPPSPFLHLLTPHIKKGSVKGGVQNIACELLGPMTGEVSAPMVESLGATYTIIGHSERRARGEGDQEIEKKVLSALKTGLSPIICVGERERDTGEKYFEIVETQVRSAMRQVSQSKLSSVVIAYEPVWAISTANDHARPATPEDAHEMILFIRKTLTELFGRSLASKVRILYGGSVTEKNASALVVGSGAQGFLVGGASLKVKEFITIVHTTYGA